MASATSQLYLDFPAIVQLPPTCLGILSNCNFMATNPNNLPVKFRWQPCTTSKFYITPSEGILCGKESNVFTAWYEGHSIGTITNQLCCSYWQELHQQELVRYCVSVRFTGEVFLPLLTIDGINTCNNMSFVMMNFGKIQFGRNAKRQLMLHNPMPGPIGFFLETVEESKKTKFHTFHCEIKFGEVSPGGKLPLTVICQPTPTTHSCAQKIYIHYPKLSPFLKIEVRCAAEVIQPQIVIKPAIDMTDNEVQEISLSVINSNLSYQTCCSGIRSLPKQGVLRSNEKYKLKVIPLKHEERDATSGCVSYTFWQEQYLLTFPGAPTLIFTKVHDTFPPSLLHEIENRMNLATGDVKTISVISDTEKYRNGTTILSSCDIWARYFQDSSVVHNGKTLCVVQPDIIELKTTPIIQSKHQKPDSETSVILNPEILTIYNKSATNTIAVLWQSEAGAPFIVQPFHLTIDAGSSAQLWVTYASGKHNIFNIQTLSFTIFELETNNNSCLQLQYCGNINVLCFGNRPSCPGTQAGAMRHHLSSTNVSFMPIREGESDFNTLMLSNIGDDDMYFVLKKPKDSISENCFIEIKPKHGVIKPGQFEILCFKSSAARTAVSTTLHCVITLDINNVYMQDINVCCFSLSKCKAVLENSVIHFPPTSMGSKSHTYINAYFPESRNISVKTHLQPKNGAIFQVQSSYLTETLFGEEIINVSYQPALALGKHTATMYIDLIIDGKPEGRPVMIALQGECETPKLQAYPSSLTFRDCSIGELYEKRITLSNISRSTVHYNLRIKNSNNDDELCGIYVRIKNDVGVLGGGCNTDITIQITPYGEGDMSNLILQSSFLETPLISKLADISIESYLPKLQVIDIEGLGQWAELNHLSLKHLFSIDALNSALHFKSSGEPTNINFRLPYLCLPVANSKYAVRITLKNISKVGYTWSIASLLPDKEKPFTDKKHMKTIQSSPYNIHRGTGFRHFKSSAVNIKPIEGHLEPGTTTSIIISPISAHWTQEEEGGGGDSERNVCEDRIALLTKNCFPIFLSIITTTYKNNDNATLMIVNETAPESGTIELDEESLLHSDVGRLGRVWLYNPQPCSISYTIHGHTVMAYGETVITCTTSTGQVGSEELSSIAFLFRPIHEKLYEATCTVTISRELKLQFTLKASGTLKKECFCEVQANTNSKSSLYLSTSSRHIDFGHVTQNINKKRLFKLTNSHRHTIMFNWVPKLFGVENIASAVTINPEDGELKTMESIMCEVCLDTSSIQAQTFSLDLICQAICKEEVGKYSGIINLRKKNKARKAEWFEITDTKQKTPDIDKEPDIPKTDELRIHVSGIVCNEQNSNYPPLLTRGYGTIADVRDILETQLERICQNIDTKTNTIDIHLKDVPDYIDLKQLSHTFENSTSRYEELQNSKFVIEKILLQITKKLVEKS